MGACRVCRRDSVPLQAHHIAGKRYAAQTVLVCLNCHSVVSQWQRQRASRSGVHAYLHGWIDLAMLWYERASADRKARLVALLRTIAVSACALAALIEQEARPPEEHRHE